MQYRHSIFAVAALVAAASPWSAPAQDAAPPAAATEQPYMLDPVETTATREREIVVRTVLAGLKRIKSTKPDDSELIVCEKSKRIGTSITSIRCGKNRTWMALGAESVRDGSAIFGMVPTGLPPGVVPANRLLPILVRSSTGTSYNAGLDTELMEFELSLLKNQDQYKGDVAAHDARIFELLEHERLAQEKEQDEFVRFVLAWNGLRRIDAAAPPECANDPECSKAHAAALERAILDNGLSVKQYNAAVLRLEIDPQFRSRVVAALQQGK